jgi:hypothetical protein
VAKLEGWVAKNRVYPCANLPCNVDSRTVAKKFAGLEVEIKKSRFENLQHSKQKVFGPSRSRSGFISQRYGSGRILPFSHKDVEGTEIILAK